MPALYNEIEEYACDWLENLVAANLIAPGRVERRSIRDLTPQDVQGPGQRHFFAGIGVWSHALRRAGWPDDVPVWTGSCPCQPYSQAGRGKGAEDERHLWPDWFRLISACRPAVVLGEQVASVAVVGKPVGCAGRAARDAASRPWLDIVRADLESIGYTIGAAVLPAASVGAPHIRHRLFFVAIRADVVGDPRFTRGWWDAGAVPGAEGTGARERFGTRGLADEPLAPSATRGVGDSAGTRRGVREDTGTDRGDARTCADEGERRASGDQESERAGATRGVADAKRDRGGPRWFGESHGRASIEPDRHGDARALADDDDGRQVIGSVRVRVDGESQHGLDPNGRSAVGGFWSDAEWIPCRDGKARPVEAGTFPLVDGAPSRVGATGALETQPRASQLRAYGNAMTADVVVEFVGAVVDLLAGGASS